MATPLASAAIRNHLLRSFPTASMQAIRPHLRFVELPARAMLVEANQPITHVHFVESGLASLVAVAGNDRIEVGLLGREGMTGLSAVLGIEITPHDAMMQVAGTAYRVEAALMKSLFDTDRSLRETMLRFIGVQLVQVSQTALANGRFTVEQRLARWLLMAQDRLGADHLGLTHDILAIMLGVRRPGVTVALHILEGERAIRARRGSITILDRDRLQSLAGQAYSQVEAAYVDFVRHLAEPANA
ncbi:MAG: Crp/Fnr family transcriptional regulator [Methylobacteriaceae bacterium]|nr:Crp/Fnr family transcriptional regulator [Methylobacteriaceae bacterium]